VFVKQNYLSSWVFTAMQSVHIRMNLSLIPALKKILDPPMTVVVGYIPTLEVQPTLVVLAPLTLWACFFVEL